MNLKVMLKGVVAMLVMGLSALLTYSYGRGDCPQCGHTKDLHACNHCSWTACLACWQRMSQYNKCPSCGRST